MNISTFMKSIVANETIVYNCLVYLLFPSYLLAGGYGIYKFVFLFPLIVLFIFAHKIYRKSWGINRKIISKENIFFYVLTLISLISLVNAKGIESYFEFAQILIGLIMIIIVIQFLNTENKIRNVIFISKFVVIILSLHGMYDYFILDQKPLATFSNENNLSGGLLLLAPFLFSEILQKKQLAFNFGLLLLVFITLYIAEARLGQIAFFVQIIISTILFLRQNTFKGKKIITWFLVISLLLFTPFVLAQVSTENTGETLSQQLERKGSSINIRMHMFTEGIRIFKESNYLGVGAGNIIIKEIWHPEKEKKQSLHMFPLTILVAYGVIPLFLYIYMYFVLIKDYINIEKLKDNLPWNRYIGNSLILFIFTSLIVSILVSTYIDYRPFYFTFGLFFASLNTIKYKLNE